jgi:hypothetical protein
MKSISLRGRFAAILVTVAVVAAVVVGFVIANRGAGGRAPASLAAGTGSLTAPVVQNTTTIEAGAKETFSPPPSGQLSPGPTLSADQAWAVWSKAIGGNETSVPANEAAVLGDLTLPASSVGSQSQWTYTAKGELVYGFKGPVMTCVYMSTFPHPAADCVRWTFLDANTGRLVDRTQQTISGPNATAAVEAK